jgi:hypothetical protein
VFHLSVVLEKSDIVDRGFDAQDDPKLVVHFYGNMTHVVLNPGSLDTSMKVVSHFTLVVSVEFATEERGNVIGLYSMNSCTNHVLIKGLQIYLAFEDYVCGILNLHEAPIVTRGEMSNDRAEFLSKLIEVLLKPSYVNVIGKFLCFGKVIDGKKGIVDLSATNALLVHFGGQLIVSVEVELQTKRSPRGYPHIAQAQVLGHEVEIVMETLGIGVLQEGFARFLVVPGLERWAWLHSREDMHQSWMITPTSDDFLDPLLLAEVFATNKLYFQTGVSCDLFSIFPNLFSQRLRKFRVIEDTDVLTPEVSGHSIGIANLEERSSDHYSVETRDNTQNLVSISLDEGFHSNAPDAYDIVPHRLYHPADMRSNPCLVPASPG